MINTFDLKYSPRAGSGPQLPMVIDDGALRAGEVRRWHDWRRAIDRVTRTLDRFRNVDRTAYETWFAAEVGPLAREVQALGEAYRAASLTQAHVIALAHLDGLNLRQAYRRVRAEEVAYAAADADARARIDAARARRERWLHEAPEPPPSDEDEPPRPRRRRRAREEEQQQFNFEFGGDDRDEPQPRARTANAPESERMARVHTVFRRISRKIHPDLATGAVGAKGRTWLDRAWTDATAARRAGDLDALWTIEAEIACVEHGPDGLSLGQLRALAARAAEMHRAVSREAARYRRDPAWNFAKARGLDRLARKLREPYEAQRRAVKFDLDEILNIWRKWDRR